MNKYICVLAAFLVFVACNNRNRNNLETEEYDIPIVDLIEEDIFVETTPIDIKDSLQIKDGLGEVVETQYEGILPAADGPGIRYELSLYNQSKSDEGVFWLSTTYLEASEEGDERFTTIGRRYTVQRNENGKKETVYELSPSDGGEKLYFLVEGDNLTLLDSEMKDIPSISNHNYTLQKK